MDNKIILRPAQLIDADTLARLWVETFPEKFGPIMGDNAEAIIYDWLRLSQRHLQTTTLATVDNVVVGFISLETPTAPKPDDGRLLWHALRLHCSVFGAAKSVAKMALMDSDHKPNKDEVYIEMLGVDKNWRGRGVAKVLMHYAETVADEKNVRRLSLNVVRGNVAALNLYQDFGFTVEKENKSRVLKWLTGYSGYYQMVKPL